jgi:hypothetical protein
MKSEFDTIYGSKYLSATEVDKPIQLVIGKVEPVSFEKPGEPSKKKALLWFNGEDKALVLNKTNASALAYAFGKNFSDWIGNTVELRRESVFFGGKTVPGLRVYPARGPRSSASLAQEMNDEVPF